MPRSPTSWNRRMPCFRQNSRIVWCIFAISGVGGGTQWSNVTTIFSGSQTFIVPISLNGSRASASISCMYNRSTSPSTIWPGRTDSAWLARARIFSDIVWPVIGIGGCTGGGRAINMAMDGPKGFRDGRHPGPMPQSFTGSAALVANAFLKAERFTVQKLLGIGVGFGGVVLIFRSQLGTAGPGQVLPMLSIVLAATCAAFATVAVKRWGHDTEPISFNAAAMAVGAAGLATVSLITREPWGIPTWPQSLRAILYLAIARSVVTVVALPWLLKEIQATTLSYIALIIPIVAVFVCAAPPDETLDMIGPAGAPLFLPRVIISSSP